MIIIYECILFHITSLVEDIVYIYIPARVIIPSRSHVIFTCNYMNKYVLIIGIFCRIVDCVDHINALSNQCVVKYVDIKSHMLVGCLVL